MRTLWRWFLHSATAIGLAFLAVTFSPLDMWWATALAGPWNDPRGDVLIVLAGSVLDDRTIGMTSYWRSVYAARTFEDDHFSEMIITGGQPDLPTASAMKAFVVAQGVPELAVRVEIASKSTRESALQVAALVHADPARYQGKHLVLLTSDYHMFRSSRVFRKAGLDLAPRPIPDARKRQGDRWQRWGIFLELIQESTKIVYYWARGWM